MERWLDDLARRLAAGRSRRTALRQLGAGLLGWMLLPPPARAASEESNSECAHWCNAVFQSEPRRGRCKSEAAHGRGPCYECGPRASDAAGRVLCGGRCVATCVGGETLNLSTCTCGCPAGKKPCGEGCIPNGSCCTDGDCVGGRVCRGGSCTCPADRPTVCGNTCVNTQTDPSHCGGCGTTCGDGIGPTTDVCVAGSCQSSCPNGQKICGKTCIPTGDCCTNGDCTGGKTCQGGACACPPDRPTDCGGTCVNTQADASNCGGCGKACGDGIGATSDVCVAGTCQSTCPAGRKLCGQTCIPNGNCCIDADCGVGKVCTGGTCRCPAGRKPCQGGCIPNGNCCTNRDCPPGKICQGGACTCPAGRKPCGDACIPRGACCTNADCTGGKRCRQGVCRCPSATIECRGTCRPRCAAGQQLNRETCRCECVGGTCGNFSTCGGQAGCICLKTTEGDGLCARAETRCRDLKGCSSSAECGGRAVCVVRSCCGDRGVCVAASAFCRSATKRRAGASAPEGASLGRP